MSHVYTAIMLVVMLTSLPGERQRVRGPVKESQYARFTKISALHFQKTGNLLHDWPIFVLQVEIGTKLANEITDGRVF